MSFNLIFNRLPLYYLLQLRNGVRKSHHWFGFPLDCCCSGVNQQLIGSISYLKSFSIHVCKNMLTHFSLQMLLFTLLFLFDNLCVTLCLHFVSPLCAYFRLSFSVSSHVSLFGSFMWQPAAPCPIRAESRQLLLGKAQSVSDTGYASVRADLRKWKTALHNSNWEREVRN